MLRVLNMHIKRDGDRTVHIAHENDVNPFYFSLVNMNQVCACRNALLFQVKKPQTLYISTTVKRYSHCTMALYAPTVELKSRIESHNEYESIRHKIMFQY